SYQYLQLYLYHFIFQYIAISSVERDERLLPDNDERITNVPAEPRLTRQKRHNHRVPLRSFLLVRGDQLDCIGFRRFSLADLLEIAAKSQGKVGQRLLPRFGGCRRTEQFLQVVRRIAEFF